MKSFVYADLPNTSIGDDLFVWSNALVFSKTNDLPLIVSGWGEQQRYFRSESTKKALLYRLRLRWSRKVVDPAPDSIVTEKNVPYVFTEKMPHQDLFKYIRPHVHTIRQSFFALLQPTYQEAFSVMEVPEIGLHIGGRHRKNDTSLPPVEYVQLIVHSLRNARGEALPVTVVTNRPSEQLNDILQLDDVHLSRHGGTIAGLMELSQSRFLILSPDNYFGYWAAFLSNAVVYMDANDAQEEIKEKNGLYREAKIDISRVK